LVPDPTIKNYNASCTTFELNYPSAHVVVGWSIFKNW
jgi:hypothetical protein